MAAITLWFLVVSITFAVRSERTPSAVPQEAVFA
jgi:hypothetical protein